MNILVSACLIGLCCRYDGAEKTNEAVLALAARHTLIPVCPEQLGGLSTPRCPCELRAGRVIARDGTDRTAEYEKGAAQALRVCRLAGCETAVLKARSPSCGKGSVYDGTFSGTLTGGNGVTAALLLGAGIRVLTEEELAGAQGLPPV